MKRLFVGLLLLTFVGCAGLHQKVQNRMDKVSTVAQKLQNAYAKFDAGYATLVAYTTARCDSGEYTAVSCSRLADLGVGLGEKLTAVKDLYARGEDVHNDLQFVIDELATQYALIEATIEEVEANQQAE